MDIAELGFRADSGQVKVAIRDLNKLGDQAAITEKQVVKGGKSTEAAFKRTGQAAQTMGQQVNRANDPVRGMVAATGRSSHSLRMMSMQLSQVAQQGAVTGNYMQALMVQLPDLALGFGAVGIAAGALAPIVFGVAQGFIGAGEEAKSLQEDIDDLVASVDSFSGASEIAGQTLAALGDDYGAFAAQIREVLRVQRDIANIEAMMALENATGRLSEQFGSFQALISDTGETLRGGYEEVLRNIIRTTEATNQEAIELANSLRDLGRAEGPEASADALQRVRVALEAAFNGAQNMDAEMREVYRAILESEKASAQLATTVDEVENSVYGAGQAAITLASNLGAAVGPMNDLIGGADGLANRMWDAATALGAYIRGQGQLVAGMNGGPDAARFGVMDELTPQGLRRDAIVSQFTLPARTRRGFSGGSGGGGGQSDAQKLHNERLRDAQRIYEQTRTAAEQYAAEVADLNELHKLGYLDADTFGRAIAALDEEFNGAGWLDDVQAGIEGVSSALAQAAVNGENMGEALVGALRNVAAAMLETQIHNGLMALAGAFLGKPVSMGSGGLLSFDGGGYTGSGSRSGGMDGKGGFLAMLHPNETVVDHSKGQGMGGVTVVQHLHLSMGATEAAQAEIARAAPKIRAAAEQGIMDRVRRTPGGRL